MKTEQAEKILDSIESCFDEIKCELNYSSPFELLIAVILSAQCTDKRVNTVTDKLFKIASTPESMINLGEDEIGKIIYSCGFYKNKSANIIKTCNKIILLYNSQVPDNFDDLVTLDGVGRKTANVMLAEVFNTPAIAVDTHVFRVSNRIGLANASNVLDTEKQLQELMPKKRWKNTHFALVLFGRYYCKAKKFDCENCVIKNSCNYYKSKK